MGVWMDDVLCMRVCIILEELVGSLRFPRYPMHRVPNIRTTYLFTYFLDEEG